MSARPDSVRGVPGNWYPYRDRQLSLPAQGMQELCRSAKEVPPHSADDNNP